MFDRESDRASLINDLTSLHLLSPERSVHSSDRINKTEGRRFQDITHISGCCVLHMVVQPAHGRCCVVHEHWCQPHLRSHSILRLPSSCMHASSNTVAAIVYHSLLQKATQQAACLNTTAIATHNTFMHWFAGATIRQSKYNAIVVAVLIHYSAMWLFSQG